MYKKGDLKLTDPDCGTIEDDGYCDFSHCHHVYDSRGGRQKLANVAFLPHSCDEWAIGGKNEIESLIADLQLALTAFTLKQPPQ